MVSTSGKEKDVVEYVVIQRRLWKGSEERWLVWGTVEESTVEKLRAEEKS